MPNLKVLIHQMRHKLLLRRVRRELAFWGIDCSKMSDQELEERAAEAHRRIQSISQEMAVSAEEAANAFRAFGKALAKIDPHRTPDQAAL